MLLWGFSFGPASAPVCVCVCAPPTRSPAAGEAPTRRNHFSSASLWILEPQAGFLGEKNQKAVPCPFLAVLLPLKPGMLRDTTPRGFLGLWRAESGC